MDVGEAEIAGDGGNGFAEEVGEFDIGIIVILVGLLRLSFSSCFPIVIIISADFPTPVFAIQDPFVLVGQVEEEFAVESARSLSDSWVQAFKMICGSYHQDSVVGFQSIDFVEEVAADPIRDQGVQIFEDEETRGLGASLAEDGLDAVFRTVKGGERADVEGWDGVGGVEG